MKWSTCARVVFYLLERQTRACSYLSPPHPPLRYLFHRLPPHFPSGIPSTDHLITPPPVSLPQITSSPPSGIPSTVLTPLRYLFHRSPPHPLRYLFHRSSCASCLNLSSGLSPISAPLSSPPSGISSTDRPALHARPPAFHLALRRGGIGPQRSRKGAAWTASYHEKEN